MAVNLDSYLGLHSQALAVREKRAATLSDNLANVNTPNYKAKDFDFTAALKGAMSGASKPIQTTHEGHLGNVSHLTIQTQYRTPHHVSLDGNTVDKEAETTEFAKNALAYEASLSFLDGKIKSMLMALRGE